MIGGGGGGGTFLPYGSTLYGPDPALAPSEPPLALKQEWFQLWASKVGVFEVGFCFFFHSPS